MSAPKSAFPLHPGIQADWDQATGMTLRDWFAGQALAGLMARPGDPGRYAECATVMYMIADAMLAERSKA